MLAEGTEARETTMARPNYQETPIEEKGMSRWRQHLGDDIPLDQFDSADSEYVNEIFGRRIPDEISQGQNPGWMGGCGDVLDTMAMMERWSARYMKKTDIDQFDTAGFESATQILLRSLVVEISAATSLVKFVSGS